MTIQSSNNTLSLRYMDAFEHTWATSKQQNNPAFFKSLKSFFFGKSVQKKDMENYLISLNNLQKSHIFTTIQRSIYLNPEVTRIFDPNQIMLKNLEKALHPNEATTLPVPHLRSENFKRYNFTCFINTALKCLLNSFKEETLKNTQERHKDLLKSIQQRLKSTPRSYEHIRKQLRDKLVELNSKNNLIEALQILINVYFNANNNKTMNTALRYFINQMFQFGQDNPGHYFRSILIPYIFAPNGYRVTLESAAQLIPYLADLIISESLEIYGLSYTTIEQEEIIDSSGELLLKEDQVKEAHHITNFTLHIDLDCPIQQDFDEMQNPEKVLIDSQQDIESNAIQLPSKNYIMSKTTRNHYSSDLSRLECLFVNPVLNTTSAKKTITTQQAAKKLMAKLDNNIVLSINHSGESNTQYKAKQLYQVTLQPQAISMHHHQISADHKTALIKNKEHKFVHHNDKRISELKSSLSTFHGIPEAIIYTVVSITQAPEATGTGKNT